MRKDKERIQKLRRTALLIVCLLGFAAALLATLGNSRFSLAHRLALEGLGSVQGLLHKGSGAVGRIWDRYINLIGVQEENTRLRVKIEELTLKLSAYREEAARTSGLRALLDMKESLPAPRLSCEIIGRDPSLWFRTVVVNRGANDGLRPGLPAVNAEGVVGQVIDAGPYHAKILLAIDPNSAIDVIVQRSRTQGIIKGDGTGYQLNYVLQNADVQKGDILITSGMGGFFPKGLPVGVVEEVIQSKRGMFQQITVRPTVDFSRLETLLLLLGDTQATAE
ncbi:MAG: rod shape-determining protein MreC [Thermodesulfobacteriota bacterium]